MFSGATHTSLREELAKLTGFRLSLRICKKQTT
jgi:hypothetical protein